MRQSKALISVFILLVLGLQILPALLPRGQWQRTWPFLVWAMYKDSRPPGPIQGLRNRVTVITQNGKEKVVTPNLVGLSGSTLGRMYLQPLRRGDSSAAQRLIDRLNRKREDPFVELRLQSTTYTVTDTGVVREDKPVLTYRVDPSRPR
jgi:hypothetical protein